MRSNLIYARNNLYNARSQIQRAIDILNQNMTINDEGIEIANLRYYQKVIDNQIYYINYMILPKVEE